MTPLTAESHVSTWFKWVELSTSTSTEPEHCAIAREI